MRMPRVAGPPSAARELEPVHAGQLDVHQDEVRLDVRRSASASSASVAVRTS